MAEDNPTGPAGGAGTPWRWFQDGTLRRVFRNAGVLLGGKTFAAICGLGSLALAARGLGPEAFGILVLIVTYIQVVGGITNFNSWQAVIRYGAVCIHDGRRGDFQRLVKFTTVLDCASVTLGAAAAAALAPLIGPGLGWSGDTIAMAVPYSVLILFTVTATPTGILRLYDRFDLVAAQSTVSPAIRLAGVGLAFLGGAGLGAYLLAWFAGGMVAGVVLVVMGWREARRHGMTAGMTASLKGLTAPHDGLWRFVWTTNLQTSLGLLRGHVTTLVVGWILGPAAAGLYKIAQDFSAALARLAGLLTTSTYPELAKLWAEGDTRQVGRLVLRLGLIAGSAAVAAVAVIVVFGTDILRLTVGGEFTGAYGVLVLLFVAAAVGVYGFALESALYAMGRPEVPLQVNIWTTVFYLPLFMALLHGMGLIGGGIAAIAAAVATFAPLALIAGRLLSRRGKSPTYTKER